MKLKSVLTTILVSASLLLAAQAQAAGFWRTGDITRTLSDRVYGGCMIHLSTKIENGCPASGWVSLDCVGKYGKNGNQMYASALTALTMGKQVSVYVHNHEKHNTYCVARRLDILN